MTPIDVIVPVHKGAEATRRCIESVLSTVSPAQQTPFELLVVNDACPESDLVRWLRDQAGRSQLTLIEQPERQGFAAAVNRAAALHPDRDLVILHSDAEVANDWLDRLVAAAASNDIATVVPFTNYGGVAGYPRSGVRNAMPAGHTLASLDLLFRRANAGLAAAVPVARGPCILVRRASLDTVGRFDGGPLGSDYGVEQDFCLRASGSGFRHILAADVYVWHWGETSFGSVAAEDLASRAELALGRLYPHYPAEREAFATRDPARPFQRRVDLLRLAESERQLVLFVAHGWGGGVRRHIDDLTAMLGERCDVLLLQPAAANRVRLSWLKAGEDFSAFFTLPEETAELAALLRALGLVRMHFHHVHGLPRAVLDLPRETGVPYDCTLHDYYAICPQYHLNAEDGRYCGEPDAAGCAACLARRPGQWGLDIASWRDALGGLLRGAERVLAPTHDVAQRIARYFPDVEPLVLPHAEPPLLEPGRVIRVATLGNLSPEKGLRIVAACAADARARRLPLAFRVIGSTTEPVPQWPHAPLSIHGQYADEDLMSLISAERPDVIWFPAQVPETYSYTLSSALAADAAVVVSSLGSLSERVSRHPRAQVVRWDAAPAEWNDALLAAGAPLAAAVRPALARVAVK
jgi:GT2 family glycosyltransferase/glycosyltransferase involved in cell wall biosynthesis